MACVECDLSARGTINDISILPLSKSVNGFYGIKLIALNVGRQYQP